MKDRGGGTRAQILETAVKLASRDGLRGLTVGLLAKAVGMSKSGLFAHFNSKDNLQIKVFRLAAEDFTDKVLRKSFQQPRGLPRITALFENWLIYLTDSSHLPGGKLLISAVLEMETCSDLLQQEVKQVQRQLFETIAKAGQIAIQEGHFRADLDLRDFAWRFYTLWVGYLHFGQIVEDGESKTYLRRAFDDLISHSVSQRRV